MTTPEDELLTRLFDQVTSLMKARYGATYELPAGLDRYRAWLGARTTAHATAVRATTRQGTGMPAPMTAEIDRVAGEADAYTVSGLYGVHYRSLVRMAALLLGDIEQAEMVVQDALIALANGPRRLTDPENAVARLRRDVVNRIRSVSSPATRGRDSAAAGDLAIGDALRILPDRQREAIVLRYYADLTEAEVAEAMSISRGAVKSHTARGMAALRAALEM